MQQAYPTALPGDTLLVLTGTYNQRENINDLDGTESDPIYIRAETSGSVIYQGGTEAFNLTRCSYVIIEGFIYEQQTGNGVNISDGGDYDVPTHHITVRDCIFRDMNASGNNDLLKLSGVDDFEIYDCTFMNGSTGGSGIDMVGCHNGTISDNILDECGVTGIQAKGGTQFIRIERNYIKNISQRGLNLGGSTGLEFFRPPLPDPIVDAFEAADLDVVSNLFIGCRAPIAYVGCVRVKVLNNTIYYPDNWVMRILQETTVDGFLTCGENDFRNNIIYLDRDLTEVNIGPDTDPDSFTFSNNVWYNEEDPGGWTPILPVEDVNQVIDDPLFIDAESEDFHIPPESPAVESGINVPELSLDYDKEPYYDPPSSGAYEGNSAILAIEDVRIDLQERNGEVHIFGSGFPDEAIYGLSIQRSVNALDWERVIEIRGFWPAGQKFSTLQVDSRPLRGRSYYRIIEINEHGQQAVIGMSSITVDYPSMEYQVDDHTIRIYAQGIDSEITIVTAGGALILRAAMEEEDLVIDRSHLPSGMYYLHARYPGHSVVHAVYLP